MNKIQELFEKNIKKHGGNFTKSEIFTVFCSYLYYFYPNVTKLLLGKDSECVFRDITRNAFSF